MPLPRRVATVSALLAALILTAGCSSTVHLEPAQYANDPLCADISVRLPDAFENPGGQPQERQWTDAQATGAWGEPTSVLLRCGVEPPGPSTLQCVTFRGVDWVVDSSERPWLRITSYGRTPAVQVYANSEAISPDRVLDSLSRFVTLLPADAECTSLEDATPAPETQN